MQTQFLILVSSVAALGLTVAPARAQVESDLNNFFLLGTQPDPKGKFIDAFQSSQDCMGCHETTSASMTLIPIFPKWAGSMKANATRDPLWHAALAIANQDAPMSGDLCIRCHAPVGWLAGRSIPTDGSALLPDGLGTDYEGVTCTICHRMVDPIARPENPPEDDPIRSALLNAGLLPTSPGNGSLVIDPVDVRRGPFPYMEGGISPYVPLNIHPGLPPIIYSPLHTQSDICATCHDVSNPMMTRQPDGSYTPNAAGAPHATQDKYDMFPLERTFSEWANSQYASTGVQANGVFGGNHPTGVMSTCQDCHMPDDVGFGCTIDALPFYARPDLPSHDFAGGNTWVQDMIANLFPDWFVSHQYLQDSKARSLYMLQNACTLEVSEDGCEVRVRITNETGHKLPSGYPEGRRMWISVDFLDENLEPVAQRGFYNNVTADLTAHDTKVYEAVFGLDETMSQVSGLPEGPSFHFVLNNKVYKDNRIPPRGFTNAAFAAAQAAPVAADYPDGQYWDDTHFWIPPGAVSATVSVYYQTAAKEYIEFLKNENYTNDRGDVLYSQWLLTGMSPPVLMRQSTLQNLIPGVFADADCSGTVGGGDTARLADCLSGPDVDFILGCEMFDADLDGDVDAIDLHAFQNAFGQ